MTFCMVKCKVLFLTIQNNVTYRGCQFVQYLYSSGVFVHPVFSIYKCMCRCEEVFDAYLHMQNTQNLYKITESTIPPDFDILTGWRFCKENV